MEPRTAKQATSRQLRLAGIAEIAASRRWSVVDLAAWDELRRAFPSVAESTLRHDLFETGLPLDPLVEGVRFDTLEDLCRSLAALAACHRASIGGRPEQPITPARKRVIEGRRKAEAVLRNPKVAAEKRESMREKFLWLRTWLENPDLFADWARLRMKKIRNPAEAS